MKNDKKIFIPDSIAKNIENGSQLIIRKDSEGFWVIHKNEHVRDDDLQGAINKICARV